MLFSSATCSNFHEGNNFAANTDIYQVGNFELPSPAGRGSINYMWGLFTWLIMIIEVILLGIQRSSHSDSPRFHGAESHSWAQAAFIIAFCVITNCAARCLNSWELDPLFPEERAPQNFFCKWESSLLELLLGLRDGHKRGKDMEEIPYMGCFCWVQQQIAFPPR